MQYNLVECVGRYASNPYYCEESDVYIWSIEELCYYIKENIFIIDRAYLQPSLFNWIENECGLYELARILKKSLRSTMSHSELIRIILEYTHYFSAKETNELIDLLKKNCNSSDVQVNKLKSDFLMKQGKYRKAIRGYNELADSQDRYNSEDLAILYNNIGTCYARLFEFKSASEYYLKAYRLSSQKNYIFSYLSSKRMDMGEREYIDFVASDEFVDIVGYVGDILVEFEVYYGKLLSEYEGSEQKSKLDKALYYAKSQYGDEYDMEIEEMMTNIKGDFKRNEG